MVGSYFLGPIGGAAGMIAGQRIGQEQANVMYGRPFLENTGQYTSDTNLVPILTSLVGSGIGSGVGSAVGGVAGNMAGQVGGYVGGQAGGYFGGQAGRALVRRPPPRDTRGFIYGGY
ncbi:MAG: hypothetical protein IT462_05860 [Planctomycetes bacterium]|nr:hypothetical protein [Planctomycetota bacterium]